MRTVKVFRTTAHGDKFIGQFPWLESDGLRAAAWWAFQHGYGPTITVKWA